MNFIKYQHVEKLGASEVEGLLSLTEPCYVFPKLDGTNASVWLDETGSMCFGSRNRELSMDADNAGFMEAMLFDERLEKLYDLHHDWRLHGEWLVTHTIKDYEGEAWRKFYVFDVSVIVDGELEYLHFDAYAPVLESLGIEIIPPLAIVHGDDPERFIKLAQGCTYLMADGKQGEGVVIKRYGFKNRYGRTVWAKVVNSEFKTRHTKTMGPVELKATKQVEEEVAIEFVTPALVNKIHANIVNEQGGWSSKMIPRLLQTVFYDLVREEMWAIVKKYKNPVINFGSLHKWTVMRTKQVMPELF